MSYALFHVASTRLIKIYDTIGGARRGMTVSNKNSGFSKGSTCWANGVELNWFNGTYAPYAITDIDNYDNVVVGKKIVINLMSGEEVEIPTNTPHCCDPSSETYWSM